MRATQIFRQSMPARGNNSARGADGRHSRCPLLFNGRARAHRMLISTPLLRMLIWAMAARTSLAAWGIREIIRMMSFRYLFPGVPDEMSVSAFYIGTRRIAHLHIG